MVPKHGWTHEALSVSAEQLGFPGIAHGMFPYGPVDLVIYFVDLCNKELVNKTASLDLTR